MLTLLTLLFSGLSLADLADYRGLYQVSDASCISETDESVPVIRNYESVRIFLDFQDPKQMVFGLIENGHEKYSIGNFNTEFIESGQSSLSPFPQWNIRGNQFEQVRREKNGSLLYQVAESSTRFCSYTLQSR